MQRETPYCSAIALRSDSLSTSSEDPRSSSENISPGRPWRGQRCGVKRMQLQTSEARDGNKQQQGQPGWLSRCWCCCCYCCCVSTSALQWHVECWKSAWNRFAGPFVAAAKRRKSWGPFPEETLFRSNAGSDSRAGVPLLFSLGLQGKGAGAFCAQEQDARWNSSKLARLDAALSFKWSMRTVVETCDATVH
jgi:hypothetical protein